MNYQDPRGVIYRLLDMVCDISVQRDTKEITDGLISRFLGESENINYKESVSKLVDLFCDLSMQKDLSDVINVLYENISQFSKDDIKEITGGLLGILRDVPTYDGVRELLYKVLDMLCDVSVYNEAKDVVEILLEKASDLPDYDILVENIKLIIEEVQDIIRDLPTYEGAVKIVYEVMNLVRDLPIYDSVMDIINLFLLGKGSLAGLLGVLSPPTPEIAEEENSFTYKMVSNF